MPRFKQRIEIDAWQFTDSPSDNNPPDWIVEARKKWPDVGGIKIFKSDEPEGTWKAHVEVAECNGRTQTAWVGDWIVRHYGCDPLACSYDNFNFQYEPVTTP